MLLQKSANYSLMLILQKVVKNEVNTSDLNYNVNDIRRLFLIVTFRGKMFTQN